MSGRWFANFGAGTACRLHGSEVVLTPAYPQRMVTARVVPIQMTDEVKRAIEDAVRRALRRRRGQGDV